MTEQSLEERMREDWNKRAREDANYYVAFAQREQDEADFLATGTRLVEALRDELKRLPPADPRSRRALEIGCGPGRLMLPLSQNFGEVHGVDVSDEMAARARERLHNIPHAHVHVTDGANLAAFADESFDFVWSYAVFQHIPERGVVVNYMREIGRVLKPGGIFRGQFNGWPRSPGVEYGTWEGCRFSAAEIREFTAANSFDLLELFGVDTQYMWTTWRKQGGAPAVPRPDRPVRLRRVTNAWSSEPLVPASGRFALVSFWAEALPTECELNGITVRVAGVDAPPYYLGPPAYDSLQQLNIILPSGTPTGLHKADVFWRGTPLFHGTVRVIPAAPLVPRVITIADAVDLLSPGRTRSGLVRVVTEEMLDPRRLVVTVDGRAAEQIAWFRTDPIPPRYDFNVKLPGGTPPGLHELEIRYERRRYRFPLLVETTEPRP